MFCKMIVLKDTHKENTLSNKTQVLTKSMNINIWEFGILDQLCMIMYDSHTQIEFSKKSS